MQSKSLFFNEISENEETAVIEAIIGAIKKDGFDTSDFSLFSVECHTWEFISNKNPARGFLLFYDPEVVTEPVPQYQLLNGSVAYSFNARNITEAYIQHNRCISDEDYYLLSKEYGKAEKRHHEKAQKLAIKYGPAVICEICNCTEAWLDS